MSKVDVVIPVYNEERDLPKGVVALRQFLSENLPDKKWRIVVADNGSTDGTLAMAQALSQKYDDVAWIHLDQKGRGRALKKAWLESDADIVSYMDVDLSTNLDAFPRLVALIDARYDVATGSRLLPQSRTVRSFKREFISRMYNVLVKLMFFTRFSDAQCGFKAMSRAAARKLLPLVKDTGWFFDTELLIIAEKRGFRIGEVPVEWMEDPDTRVRILRTAMKDIQGLLRLRFGGIPRVSVEG